MGWFEDQIEYRKKREIDLLSDSFQNIAKAVSGRKIGTGWMEEGSDVKDAISALLRYFNVKEREVPAKLSEFEDILDYQLSSSGIMYREVALQKGWHKDAMGAMITTRKSDGVMITVLPEHSGGFYYTDPLTAKKIHIDWRREKDIGDQAFCFYRPFPQSSMSLRDLFLYMRECLTTWDVASFCICAGIITVLGMFLPKLNHILIGDVIHYQSHQLLTAVLIFMVCVTIGSMLFTVIKQLLMTRINTKMSVNVGAATMMRVLSLPSDFFRDYSTGELEKYITYMNSLCTTMVNAALSTGITGLFSLIYLVQIFAYARSLVFPSLCVTILTLIISIMAASVQVVISKEMMTISAKENGLVISLINGIQKIRLSGAENRAFAKWANLYAKGAALTYHPPAIIRLSQVFTTAISLIGTIVMYYAAVKSGISAADYYAFNSAYAYITAAFTSLAAVAVSIGTIRPVLELTAPLMEAVPEVQEGKETVTSLSGGLELSHVSFRYDANGPMIIDDLSVTIPARQYVAIVGKTGCGKSTLIRLLLGFETPVKGSIFYDKKDTKGLDMKSVRKHMGTVMQDGKIFAGSIYDNIVISKPSLGVEDAWEAAEISGFAEDIRNMPMGMNTILQDGMGGISGGQRQRLIIARAVAPKPKILLLDEATSALDNITQRKVSEALDQMKCTRIVIAHRLSTIRHCDRILVLNNGKIEEDGTYDELLSKNGIFADLVSRQKV